MVEHECPRCHRQVELPFGALCRACREEIDRRARRMGHLAAAVSTLVLAGYVVARLPADPRARMMSALAVAVWYVVSNLMVQRAARELLP